VSRQDLDRLLSEGPLTERSKLIQAVVKRRVGGYFQELLQGECAGEPNKGLASYPLLLSTLFSRHEGPDPV
jgi:hypothetical protein